MQGRHFFLLFFLVPLSEAACPPGTFPKKAPISNDCSSFYTCGTNSTQFETCPEGLYYNCMNLECEKVTFPACCILDPNILETPLDKTCRIEGTTLKDERNCGAYFVCRNSKVVREYCPNNEEFDGDLGACSKKICGEAGKAVTAKNSASPMIYAAANTTISASTSRPFFCESIQEGKTYADMYDCHGYYVCQKGVYNRAKCLFGTTWDCKKNKCALLNRNQCCKDSGSVNSNKSCWVNGMKFATKDSDALYYECVQMKVVTRSCPPGKTFNRLLRMCL